MLLKVLTIQKGARYGWDGSMASGNEAALCQNGIKLYQGAKEGESPRRALHSEMHVATKGRCNLLWVHIED